MKKHKNN